MGAASIPEIAVPPERAQELVEAIRPMSSSTSTPPAALTPTPVEATAVTSDAELPSADAENPVAGATQGTAPSAPVVSSQFGQAPPSTATPYSETLPFVDPAPFVGTRPTAPGDPAPASDFASTDADFGLSVAGAAETKAPESRAPSALVASHPLARTLNELATRVDNGDLEVASFEEGMSPEAALAATLAAMLKRAR